MIIIDEKLCKGCGICVYFCPNNVYIMETTPKIVNEDKCTKCELCELLCPDLAILIE